MHRLLVLSGAVAAIVAIPALANAADTGSPHQAIGSAIVDGGRAADYWTPARMAAASALRLSLVRTGEAGTQQS